MEVKLKAMEQKVRTLEEQLEHQKTGVKYT